MANHTAHRTEFDHLDFGDQAWRRAGYVGSYQRFKEKPVQVRIRVWAQWPRRLLVGSIYIGFAVALVFFLLSILGMAIPANVWIFTALPILAAIAISFLMYTSSVPESQAAEERLEARLSERIGADEEIPGVIYDVDAWEDHRERLIDEAREKAKQRAPYGGSRVKKALAEATSSVRGTVGPSRGPDREEPARDDEPEAEEEASFLDRARFWSEEGEGSQGDEEEREDRQRADEEPGAHRTGSPQEAENEEGSSWTDRVPLLGRDPSKEPSDDDEEAAKASTEGDEGAEQRSLRERIPFLGSRQGDEAPDGDAAGQPTEPDAPDEQAAEDRPGLLARAKRTLPGVGGPAEEDARGEDSGHADDEEAKAPKDADEEDRDEEEESSRASQGAE